jgi:hypothetical protein
VNRPFEELERSVCDDLFHLLQIGGQVLVSGLSFDTGDSTGHAQNEGDCWSKQLVLKEKNKDVLGQAGFHVSGWERPATLTDLEKVLAWLEKSGRAFDDSCRQASIAALGRATA